MRSYWQKGPWNTSNRWTVKKGGKRGKKLQRGKGTRERERLYNPDVFALVLAEMVLLNPPVQSPLWISSASPDPARSLWVLCWTRTSAYPAANKRTFKKKKHWIQQYDIIPCWATTTIIGVVFAVFNYRHLTVSLGNWQTLLVCVILNTVPCYFNYTLYIMNFPSVYLPPYLSSCHATSNQ